jgi:RAT1-interacting protein
MNSLPGGKIINIIRTAMTSSGHKRSIDELLRDEDHSRLPKTRQKLELRIRDTIDKNVCDSRRSSTEHAETPAAAFLPYPDLTNPNPVSIPFQQPSQLISFSYDASHTQEFDDSALRYFVHPRLGADLSFGYKRWIKRPDERGRIDALLKAIAKAKEDGVSRGVQLPEIGVVSWRGVMTKYVLSLRFLQTIHSFLKQDPNCAI